MPESEIIFVVQESPEGGYEAQALGQAIFTQADSLEELKAMVLDAGRVHPPLQPAHPPAKASMVAHI